MVKPLPADLLAEANQAISHRDDLYRLGCKFGQWFCHNGFTEDECADWLIDQSPLRGNYTARQFEYQLRRAVKFAYESFEPGGSGVATADPQDLQALAEWVKGTKVRDKRYILALIQHAINHGRNPVYATSRQLAALAGVKSYAKAAEAMNRMQESLAGGFLVKVTYDGVYGHSRLWELNTTEGYINTMHDTYVPSPDDPEIRFRELVEPLPAGTAVTVTSVASRLGITRPKAKRLLVEHTAEFFGGGYFEGDRRTKQPATWWRGFNCGHHHGNGCGGRCEDRLTA